MPNERGAGQKPESEKERNERLEALREKLYSRGFSGPKAERHQLHDIKRDVARSWPGMTSKSPAPPPPPPAPEPVVPQEPTEKPVVDETEQGSFHPTMLRRSKRRYRTTLIVIGLAFFAVALLLSATFLFFGKNTISGENINIEFSEDAPFAVGGGEEVPFSIFIANNNAVPIESATLIIEYPAGTQSAEEQGRELFRDRTQIERINPGEVLRIPVRAVVFGEENEEKVVNAAIEYRVEGSNATFFKEAEPYRFKISSSPVIIDVEGITETASGQEIELDLLISSNAPTVLSDVLIRAEYPQGYDFSSSEPGAVSGRDTWLIETLEPEEERRITLRGVLIGEQNDTKVFRFSVGVANERDRFGLASIFTAQSHEVSIEQPFLDVSVRIDGSPDAEVIIPPGDNAGVVVSVRNTLSDTLYDIEVKAVLSGNALDDAGVRTTDGFYDSTTNTVTFDARSSRSLEELQPGESASVSFSVVPREGGDASQTPQVTLSTDVRGRRVSEDRVPQTLSSAVTKTIKVESSIELGAQALYSIGPFANTGPMPPEAEKVTTYTVTMGVANGSNAVTDVAVEATLPSYVTWLGLETFGSDFSYNTVSRAVTWDVGDLAAGELQEASFQVSFLPSISQVGQTPTILGEQRLRATDRFTGTTIRSTAPALTTRLRSDPDPDAQDGEVQPTD